MTGWTPLCIHLILLITPMITDQIGLHLVLLLLLIVSIKAIPPGKQWRSSSVLLCVPSRCVRVSLYPYFLFRTESVESYNNVFMSQEKKSFAISWTYRKWQELKLSAYLIVKTVQDLISFQCHVLCFLTIALSICHI